jgi:hypothetical protein
MGNILAELLPRTVRLWLYVIVFFVLLGLGSWLAAEGNVTEAVVAFLGSLAPLLAAGNVNPAPTAQVSGPGSPNPSESSASNVPYPSVPGPKPSTEDEYPYRPYD